MISQIIENVTNLTLIWITKLKLIIHQDKRNKIDKHYFILQNLYDLNIKHWTGLQFM